MRRIFILLSIIMSLSALPEAVIRAAEQGPPCEKRPDLVGACFVVHGRLSFYNGNPSFRIWRIGTKRILGVSDWQIIGDESAELANLRLPPDIQKRLQSDIFRTDIFGDFTVCPLSVERPGWMQDICIAHAENLVAKPR